MKGLLVATIAIASLLILSSIWTPTIISTAYAESNNALPGGGTNDNSYTLYKCMQHYCTYNLQIDDKTFPIYYGMTGEIKDIIVNTEKKSLIVHLSSDLVEPLGSLHISLPRDVIQATGNNNGVSNFIVLAGEKKIEPYIIEDSETGSVVRLNFEKGTDTIEIIGTWVVPEFPTFIVGIIGAVMGVVIIVSRIKMKKD